MATAGVLAADERVELIDGQVQRLSPRGRRHVLATRRLFDFFVRTLEGRASVYKEDPHALAQLDSEPEPDVLVCSNPDVEAYGTPSTSPLLVIEVADSTLQRDLGPKARLYARAGIPEYWVVNLVDDVLVVFRSPVKGRYRLRTEHDTSATISPTAWPDVSVVVGSVFP